MNYDMCSRHAFVQGLRWRKGNVLCEKKTTTSNILRIPLSNILVVIYQFVKESMSVEHNAGLIVLLSGDLPSISAVLSLLTRWWNKSAVWQVDVKSIINRLVLCAFRFVTYFLFNCVHRCVCVIYVIVLKVPRLGISWFCLKNQINIAYAILVWRQDYIWFVLSSSGSRILGYWTWLPISIHNPNKYPTTK